MYSIYNLESDTLDSFTNYQEIKNSFIFDYGASGNMPLSVFTRIASLKPNSIKALNHTLEKLLISGSVVLTDGTGNLGTTLYINRKTEQIENEEVALNNFRTDSGLFLISTYIDAADIVYNKTELIQLRVSYTIFNSEEESSTAFKNRIHRTTAIDNILRDLS